MDGSGRISKRNQRFLRPIKAYKDVIVRRAEPRTDSQQPSEVVKPRVVEVARNVPDTAGYSTILPEVVANEPCGEANGPDGVASEPDNVFGVANGGHPGSTSVERLRRSARNVWRPSHYTK